MVTNYAYEGFNSEKMARASGKNLSISLKKTVETLKEIRGKKVSVAIKFLEGVISLKSAVAYRRYGAEMAHRKGKGIAAGGFPVKVAEEILILLKSAMKNASESELGEDLYLISTSARKGTTRYHYGRYSGRKMKSTNVEIIVGLKDKPTKKVVKKEEVKK